MQISQSTPLKKHANRGRLPDVSLLDIFYEWPFSLNSTNLSMNWPSMMPMNELCVYTVDAAGRPWTAVGLHRWEMFALNFHKRGAVGINCNEYFLLCRRCKIRVRYLLIAHSSYICWSNYIVEMRFAASWAVCITVYYFVSARMQILWLRVQTVRIVLISKKPIHRNYDMSYIKLILYTALSCFWYLFCPFSGVWRSCC